MKRGSDPSFFDEAVRAVTGYYGRMGRIGMDLAGIVIPIDQLRDAAARLPLEVSTPLGRLRTASDDVDVARVPSIDPESPGAGTVPSPTLVVEADGDRPGFGVFLVENRTADALSAPIHVSAFVDDGGHEVRPRLVLRPSALNLGPGEQAIVRLSARLDDSFEVGVTYRGEIAVPGLSEKRIPIVLRRRLTDEPAADEPGVTKPTTAKPAARSRRRPASTADDAR